MVKASSDIPLTSDAGLIVRDAESRFATLVASRESAGLILLQIVVRWAPRVSNIALSRCGIEREEIEKAIENLLSRPSQHPREGEPFHVILSAAKLAAA